MILIIMMIPINHISFYCQKSKKSRRRRPRVATTTSAANDPSGENENGDESSSSDDDVDGEINLWKIKISFAYCGNTFIRPLIATVRKNVFQ